MIKELYICLISKYGEDKKITKQDLDNISPTSTRTLKRYLSEISECTTNDKNLIFSIYKIDNKDFYVITHDIEYKTTYLQNQYSSNHINRLHRCILLMFYFYDFLLNSDYFYDEERAIINFCMYEYYKNDLLNNNKMSKRTFDRDFALIKSVFYISGINEMFYM